VPALCDLKPATAIGFQNIWSGESRFRFFSIAEVEKAGLGGGWIGIG
jgi:hypothetical protein